MCAVLNCRRVLQLYAVVDTNGMLYSIAVYVVVSYLVSVVGVLITC
jgi:hypothetical protein